MITDDGGSEGSMLTDETLRRPLPRGLQGIKARLELPHGEPPHAIGCECFDPLPISFVPRDKEPDQEIPFTSMPMTAPDQANLPKVLVGPIVGHVTATTARILMEVDKDCELICQTLPYRAVRQPGVLKQNPLADEVVTVRSIFTAFRPQVLYLDQLVPSTHYILGFPNVNCPLPSAGFITRPAVDSMEFSHMRLAVVAGNSSYLDTREDQHNERIQRENRIKTERVSRELWKDLYHRIHKGEIDAVLHMGGLNASMLPAFFSGAAESASEMEAHRDENLKTFELARILAAQRVGQARLESVCNVFRAMWRRALSSPSVRCVLANAPNYFAINESEVGSWLDVLDSDSNRRFVTAAAYAVYSEYIRALVHDVPPISSDHDLQLPTAAHSIHTIGAGVGVFMCDLKANKATGMLSTVGTNRAAAAADALTNDASDDLPHLGAAQWHDLNECLKEGGVFSNQRFLIIGTQERISDPESTWWFDSCERETLQLIRNLFQWRDARPFGTREVLFIAADSDFACQTGLSDILLSPAHRPLLGYDFRREKIRELSLNGIGCLSALRKTKPAAGMGVAYTGKTCGERATWSHPELSTARSAADLVLPPFSTQKVTLVGLRDEFVAIHYEKGEVNAYGIIDVYARYIPAAKLEEADAAHEIFAGNYSVRTSFSTRIIGSGLSLNGMRCGLQLFPKVDDWETRFVQLESCCCSVHINTCNTCPLWKVR